jgi:hypothetical protein
VDATAAPIASIVPISSWVGFEIGLIQTEINAIYDLYSDPTIEKSGFGECSQQHELHAGNFCAYVLLPPCFRSIPRNDQVQILLYLHALLYSFDHFVWSKQL